MKKSKDFYNDHRIRFIAFSDNNELLINTEDVCKILGISSQKRESETVLSLPSLDKAAAILAAANFGEKEDINFIEWILETFAGFNNETNSIKLVENHWDYE